MKFPSLLLALCLLVLVTSVCEACPTCKLALANGSDHSQQGYAYSIMFMISMPFLIALGWTIFVIKAVRHNRKLQQDSLAPSH